MKLFFTAAGVAAIALTLASCGGDGGASSTPTVTALEASRYTGNYVGGCFAVTDSTNYETGAQLYAKSMISVETPSGSKAGLSFRFDFFDNSTCSGEALGLLVNTNPANEFRLTAQADVAGQVAHKLQLVFGASSASFLSGPSADTVIYGTSLRLKLPRILFQAFTVNDYWSLVNNDLYEGTFTYGTDGYPVSVSTVPDANKVSVAPPIPAAPCAAAAVSWNVGGATCTSNLTPRASQTSALAVNNSLNATGSANYSCANGTWSAPTNTTCNGVYVPPTVVTCPAVVHTWTVGGQTCWGNVPALNAPNWQAVVNQVPANMGAAYRSCLPDGTWTDTLPNSATCTVRPPPPPPITDPLLLAEARNCLACHTVTGAGFSLPGSTLSFPSFQQIANFYRASPPSVTVLAARVKSGSAGVFGTTPMSANPQVSDGELAILIPWILAQPQ